MIAALRLIIPLFAVLTVIYIVLSIYSRWQCRIRLSEEWEASNKALTREDFVEKGLRDYDGSLRRKLILGVYVVPTLLVGGLIWIVNFM